MSISSLNAEIQIRYASKHSGGFRRMEFERGGSKGRSTEFVKTFIIVIYMSWGEREILGVLKCK